MFKFNFKFDKPATEESDALNDVKDADLTKSLSSSDAPNLIPNLKSHLQHYVNEEHFELIKSMKGKDWHSVDWRDGIKIRYLQPAQPHSVISNMPNSSSGETDLVPAIYEGGFAVWECTWDLLNYIKEKNINFHDKRILDLGCGAGVLGIAASFDRAKSISFHDYNAEVIEQSTIPNVVLNHQNSRLDNFVFVSGDWSFFPSSSAHSRRQNKTEDNSDSSEPSFDFILTSETIYNPDNYLKLVSIFDSCLADGGQILLAAKSHYFGVGGGTDDFASYVTKRGYQVTSDITSNSGLQREVLKISRKL